MGVAVAGQAARDRHRSLVTLMDPQSRNGVPGLAQAIELYGQPVMRRFEYEVSSDTILYWQTVVCKRRAEVVLALRRSNGQYVLHTKEFYPAGTYRLLSGRVKLGEDILKAVEREAREETGLTVHVDRFLAIIDYWFRNGGQSVGFRSYAFLLTGDGSTIRAADEEERISGYRGVSLDGLLVSAEELERLPADWRDWGRFRAAAHRVIWDVLSGDHG